MMQLTFDETKATQTAAFVLNKLGGNTRYLKLIKLLYHIDRAGLEKLGFPVTTDRHVAMDYGPVTSGIYDLIKASSRSSSPPSYWSTHLKTSANQIHVVSDPGTSELSPAEEKLMSQICEELGQKDAFTLADESHSSCPEWSDPQGSSRAIPIQKILEAIGADEDTARHVEESIGIQRLVSSTQMR